MPRKARKNNGRPLENSPMRRQRPAKPRFAPLRRRTIRDRCGVYQIFATYGPFTQAATIEYQGIINGISRQTVDA
jgi:hypothetical protein